MGFVKGEISPYTFFYSQAKCTGTGFMGRCSHWKRQQDRESVLELYNILAFLQWKVKTQEVFKKEQPVSFPSGNTEFSLSICKRMLGTLACFMTCRGIACLNIRGQGVKPLVRCWPAGSSCASGSLWESLYSSWGLGLTPFPFPAFPGAECFPSPHRSQACLGWVLVPFACSNPSMVSD